MVGSPVVHGNLDVPEAVVPTTRPTISYYLVLALAVIPVCAVTPASWCYVVYSLYTGSICTFTSRQYAFFAVALAEVRLRLHEHVISDDEPPWRLHPGIFQRVPL